MLKVIKNDLFVLKKLLIIIGIFQFVLSFFINAALLIFETGRFSGILLQINDISAKIITAGVVILMLSNLFLKQRKIYSVYDMSDIPDKDIIAARYLEIFFTGFFAGLLSLIHVSCTDAIIAAKYADITENIVLKDIVFSGRNNFLYILFPVSIGVFGMVLQSSILLLCNLYNRIANKLKALSACIGAVFFIIAISFFGSIFVRLLGIDFNNSFTLTGLLPYNTLLSFFYLHSFSRYYIFAVNILQPFLLIYLLMVIILNSLLAFALKNRTTKKKFRKILISYTSVFFALFIFLMCMEIYKTFSFNYLKEGQTSIVMHEGESCDISKYYFAQKRYYNISNISIRIFKQAFDPEGKHFVWEEDKNDLIYIIGNRVYAKRAGIYRLSIVQDRQFFFEINSYNMLDAEVYILDNNYKDYIEVYEAKDFSDPYANYILKNDITIDGNSDGLEYLLFSKQIFYGKIYNPDKKIITVKNSGTAAGLIEETEETSIIDGLIVKWEDVIYDGQEWFSGIVHENKGLINNCLVKGNFTAYAFSGIAFLNEGTISNCIADFKYLSTYNYLGIDNIYDKKSVSGIASYNNHNILNSYVTAGITHADFYPICAYPNGTNSHIFDCDYILYGYNE